MVGVQVIFISSFILFILKYSTINKLTFIIKNKISVINLKICQEMVVYQICRSLNYSW